jgi:hypothetical protein
MRSAAYPSQPAGLGGASAHRRTHPGRFTDYTAWLEHTLDRLVRPDRARRRARRRASASTISHAEGRRIGRPSMVRVNGSPTRAPAVPFTGYMSGVTAVVWEKLEGRPVVIVGGDDGTVRVWDPATKAPVGEPFTGHTSDVNAVAWGELDGRLVVVSGGADGRVRVWDPITGTPVGDPLAGHTRAVTAVACDSRHAEPLSSRRVLTGPCARPWLATRAATTSEVSAMYASTWRLRCRAWP